MKTKNYAWLAAVFLLIGSIITGAGTVLLINVFLQPSQPVSSQTSDRFSGFVFGTSENLTQERTNIQLVLKDIDCSKKEINATVSLNVVCQEWDKTSFLYNSTSIFFQLQVPSEINDLTVTYQAGIDPKYFGGTFSYNNNVSANHISTITLELPKENFTFKENTRVSFNFKMVDAFSTINSYTYELDIPFSSGFDSYAENEIQYTQSTFSTVSIYRWLQSAELYVEKPAVENNYIVTQIMPEPYGINYYLNQTRYHWNVKLLSTSFGTDVIILTVEDVTAKNDIENYQTWGWFLVGLGIPTIISASYEFIKEKKAYSKTRTMPKQEEEKSKKGLFERLKDWDEEYSKKHPKAIWIGITIFSILLSATFFLFSIPFGFLIILSIDTMKTFIEAEATTLGFFGLIAVYLLTSYDNRIDKLEEKIQDTTDKTKADNWNALRNKIKARKRGASIAILSALISLILSFFLSITSLGILDINPQEPTAYALTLALAVTTIASTLLFIGVFSVFVMIYRIGKEPE